LNDSTSVTELLHAWREGDRSALDRLVPLVYSNLRGMAAAHLRRETGSQTIDPTALVHEAYLRLVGDTDPEFHNRAHFLGVASRVMRQILVDRGRAASACLWTSKLSLPENARRWWWLWTTRWWTWNGRIRKNRAFSN
jgi:RNA polymerase sigma factor (TIGR02999 family)